jgi:hypothetical protein
LNLLETGEAEFHYIPPKFNDAYFSYNYKLNQCYIMKILKVKA